MADRLTPRPVYKALHRPLTICGVDRRLFFLALLLGAATFNLFYSFLGGLLMFLGLYGFSVWAIPTRRGDVARWRRPPCAAATTLASTRCSSWMLHHGEAVADRPRLQSGRRTEYAAGALGLRRRDGVPDQSGSRRLGVSTARCRLRRIVARRAADAHAPVRSRPATAQLGRASC